MRRIRLSRPTFSADDSRIYHLLQAGGVVAISCPVTPATAAEALVAANIGGALQMTGAGWALDAGFRVESWEALVRLLRAACYESAALNLAFDALAQAEEELGEADAEAVAALEEAWRRYRAQCDRTARAKAIIACAEDPSHPWWHEKPDHPQSGADFVAKDGSKVRLGYGRSWICLRPEGDKVIVEVGAGPRWKGFQMEGGGWFSAFQRAEAAESVGVRWRRDDREAVLEALAARSVS